MKKILLMPLALVVAAGVFTGCKTTEANYSAAYEIARQKRDAGLTSEELAGMRREEAMPKTLYKGDSIPLKGMYVKKIEGTDPQMYTVVVASFKQLFNSQSVFKRLKEAGGLTAEPVLLQDPRDKKYYVGAVTTSSLDSAVSARRSLEEASPVVLKSPCPFILRK